MEIITKKRLFMFGAVALFIVVVTVVLIIFDQKHAERERVFREMRRMYAEFMVDAEAKRLYDDNDMTLEEAKKNLPKIDKIRYER